MSSDDCFAFIARHVPYIKNFQASWRIPGSKVARLRPDVFVQNVLFELPFLPRSAAIEIFQTVQSKISRDFNAKFAEEDDRVPDDLATAWANAPLPASEIPSSAASQAAANFIHTHGGSATAPTGSTAGDNGSHGGGVRPHHQQTVHHANDQQIRIPPPPLLWHVDDEQWPSSDTPGTEG
jgi:hypothetical protein